MSGTPALRSHDSLRFPSESLKSSEKITVEEEKFIRKLVRVLAKVVDEKDLFAADDNELNETAGFPREAPSEEQKKNPRTASLEWSLSLPPYGQDPKGNEKANITNNVENAIRFMRTNGAQQTMRKSQPPYHKTIQIRNSLNALGGGGRTSQALKTMDDKIREIRDTVFMDNREVFLAPGICVQALNGASDAVVDVTKAFEEFRIFSTNFSGSDVFTVLENLREKLKITATKMDLEYGSWPWSRLPVDDYLNSVFGMLASDFQIYIQQLTNIAEKEIASIRRIQEFTSQRYLNLTTVATFLSNVTATTLQITADNSASRLTPITNTLWFISLVFSTASAVYSLLGMTWRQSSVRQPDLSLPYLAKSWLQNGPMYSLIAALCTFSVGVCLLSFVVVEQQGGLASAAIPTAFAGSHASAVALLSGWFLLEKWEERHRHRWLAFKNAHFTPVVKAGKRIAERNVERICAGALKILRRLKKFSSSCAEKNAKRTQSANTGLASVADIEFGQSTPPPSACNEQPKQRHSEEGIETVYMHLPEPEHEAAIPERELSLETHLKRNELTAPLENEAKYKPLVERLHFSPDGRHLASAISDTVTVYDVRTDFDVTRSCTVSGADEVQQIALNRNNDLLVRSSKQVNIWNSIHKQPLHYDPSANLDGTVASARWVDENDAGKGFVCAVGRSVKVFGNSCQELRSYDLWKSRKIKRVLDVAPFRKKYILSLVTTPEEYRLLVFNQGTGSIDCDVIVEPGHTSIVTSRLSTKVLLYGSETGVEIAEFSSDDEESLSILRIHKLYRHTYLGHELSSPEAAIALHGEMIIGYSAGEIISLAREKADDDRLSALHIFTTPNAEATVENPTSFAFAAQGWFFVPYLFAFRDKDGHLKVWSIQSDRRLADCERAKDFDVHDRRNGPYEDATVTKGRYLILPPPEVNA